MNKQNVYDRKKNIWKLIHQKSSGTKGCIINKNK